MPIVKPSSDLQRNISDIYEVCHDTLEPVYITRNGETSLVVMDAAAFDARMDLQQKVFEREMRTYQGIVRGYEEAREGKLTSLDEARREKRDGR